MADEPIISRYTNCEVELHYLTDNSQFRDRGTLLEFDGSWLALEKPGHELLLVPLSAVRLVKPLSPPKDRDSLLLRPVDSEPESVQRTHTSKS